MSLAGLLTSSIGYFKLRGLIDKAVVDNAVFRLHYRFTCGLFFVGCALVSSMYLFGQPINCIDNILNGNSKSKEKAITTFCWISHTHTIPLPYNETSWDAQVHPGVGPGQDDGAYDEHRHVHSYYQWVPFALFLQGTMFFVPHWLWKRFEGGMIQQMTDGSRGFKLPNAITTQGRGRGHCDVLCDYLIKTLRTRGTLVFVYVFCEFLNLVNTAGHIFLTNRFLGGVFLDYGPTVFQLSDMDQTERRDPLIVMFPRVAKCTFHQYGSSGSIERRDALCILPLNVIHEKIYIFLWFWLVCLALLSALAVLYRMVVLGSPLIRIFVLRRVAPTTDREVTAGIVHSFPLGDYLLIHLLSKNLDPLHFRELLTLTAHRLALSG